MAFEGRDGHTFGIPIVGHVNLTDRVALNYDIPLQYVEIPGSSFFETGVILSFPIQVITPSQDHRWSWEVTPTAAFASTGSKEIMGAGALTNVISYRWRDITLTYGNYLSFFEGETLVSNDPEFPKGTSQQIMKNGLKVTMPFGKGWLCDVYAAELARCGQSARGPRALQSSGGEFCRVAGSAAEFAWCGESGA